MIDTKQLLEDARARDLVMRKGVTREELDRFIATVQERNRLSSEVQNDRSSLNALSKEIGQLLGAGRTDDSEAKKAEVGNLKKLLQASEAELSRLEGEVEYTALRLPNPPHEDCPIGKTDADNPVLSTHGYDPADYEGREFAPHWEVAERLGIFDAERAAKLSGSMFSVLRGKGAKLLRALVKLGFDLNEETYEEITTPHFVRTETLTATGQLPKFESDAYRLRDDDLWAIPTGEVPLMSLHRGELLEESDLPKRYLSYNVCFRREAGAAGKDTRGLQRLHEFHKVELVRLCSRENVQSEFDALLADCRRPLDLLGLPYRIVDVCTGDLPFSAVRVHDLEVYAPGADRWLEVSSVGIFGNFQARRGNARYRPAAGGKTEFLHALNGSAMATPRVWAAIIEHGQQPDGSVVVPEALREFMGSDRIS